ncbi:MAG: DinB family protein [Gemmatimonas sp.]
MPALDTRPSSDEHAPFALTYITTTAQALAAVGNPSLLALLSGQAPALRTLLDGVDDVAAQRSYAPGKWTLAESLLHVADTERVFIYRVLRIARGDKTPLPGFDQDAWVPESGASARTLADILTEIDAVRAASLALIGSLDDSSALKSGTASGHPASARALAWMIAGHFAHHLEITRTRYLGKA